MAVVNLAEVLRLEQERIMMAWEERVRIEIEATRTQGRTALRDHLPNFLIRLAAALDPKTSIKDACEQTSICETHGKERADLLQYTIPQVLHEYMILRNFVFDTLEIHGPLTQADRNTILNSFDHAIREAADAFMYERTEREREKRRLVELDRDRTQKQLTNLEADTSIQKTFVATLTHDLRNPIGSARMALELLLLEIPDTPEIKDIAQIISRNLGYTETMLLDLLDANRIKSGHKLPLKVEACDLTHLTKSILAEMSSVHGRGFVLDANESIRGYWSANRLRRVICNLIDNALKYGSVNSPITIGLAQTAARTTIAIHNEGTPIPLAEQVTIFEPYYRANEQSGKNMPGWGLGLTLVQAVAQAHGGSVRVDSAAASGTNFIVTLPNDSRPFQS